jgi:RNA recognition motif-containing protein
MKLFIGGINYETTEANVSTLLAPFGEVERVRVATDKETNKSKGFAFATMLNDEQARKAIAGLNQSTFGERTITVREARPKKGSDTPPPNMSLTNHNGD